MRIQSDRKSYSTDEEIVLDASCGFYVPPNGYGAASLSYAIACCEYMDVSINGEVLDKYPGTDEEFDENCYGYLSGGQEKFYYLETEDFDSKQLILKEGFLGQINKESLQYHFAVTLRVNPDAPESFSGKLYIRVYDHSHGNAYITVKFQKDGDTITLLPN